MNNPHISATRLVALTLALVALMGIALPIYSSAFGRVNPKPRATPAARPNCLQKQPAAPANAPRRSNCPRETFCCLCHCC